VVLKYLARYCCRVAMSNQRLLCVSADTVTFRWKDYRAGGKQKAMPLSLEEFARRFLQHVLPKAFVRIRHYGLLANRNRESRLSTCRKLLGVSGPALPATVQPASPDEPRCCRVCGQGVMIVVELLPRQFAAAGEAGQDDAPGKVDSS
jgi:hypothetical protein